MTSPAFKQNAHDALADKQLQQALAGRDVAAVILEPTGAHWGTHPLAASYLHELRRLTRETGTLMIMDEVITGFRMAPGFSERVIFREMFLQGLTVLDIMETGSNDVYVVKSADREVLLPAIKDVIRGIDLEAVRLSPLIRRG